MNAVDWRADELQRQVAAVRANLEAHDNAISTMEADLQIALSAEGEFRDDMANLGAQQAALRSRPPERYMDSEGFEQMGASPATLREYEQLAHQIKQREAAHQRWVNARRVNGSDGVITTSWSPRNAIDVQQRIQRLRVSRSVLANELERLEGQMSPGQLCQSGRPAAELIEHRQRIAGLRERLGVTVG